MHAIKMVRGNNANNDHINKSSNYLVQYLDNDNELSIVDAEDFYLETSQHKLPHVRGVAKVKNPKYEKPNQRDGTGRLIPQTFEVVVRAISDSKPQLTSWLGTMMKTGLFFVEDNNNPPFPKRGCIPKDLTSSEDEGSQHLPQQPPEPNTRKTGKRKKKSAAVHEVDGSDSEENEKLKKRKEKQKREREVKFDSIHSKILELQAADISKSLVQREPQDYLDLQKRIHDLETRNSQLEKDLAFYKDMAQTSTILQDAKKVLRLANANEKKTSTPECVLQDTPTYLASPPSSLPRHQSLPTLAHLNRSLTPKLSKTPSPGPSTSSIPSSSSASSYSLSLEFSNPSTSLESSYHDVEEMVDSVFQNPPSPTYSCLEESYPSDKQSKNKSPDSVANDNVEAEVKSGQLKYSSKSEGVMEIMPNTGVYMKEEVWEGIQQLRSKSVTSAARKIFDDVFTEHSLLTCTARGGPNAAGRRALNQTAVNAIINRVNKLAAHQKWPPCSADTMNKSLGSKLSEMRQKERAAAELLQHSLKERENAENGEEGK